VMPGRSVVALREFPSEIGQHRGSVARKPDAPDHHLLSSDIIFLLF